MSDTKNEAVMYDLLAALANKPPDYYRLPTPHPYDDVFAHALRRFQSLEETERATFFDCLSDDDRIALRGIGAHMAEVAVRLQKPEYIASGLLAIVLGDFRVDFRDDYMILSLLYRSCELLNVSGRAAFAEAARWATPTAHDDLIEFAEKPPTIKAMAFREAGTGADFHYQQVWSTSGDKDDASNDVPRDPALLATLVDSLRSQFEGNENK